MIFFHSNKLQQTYMHFKLIVCLALFVTLSITQQPQIIDFTYTRLLEEANYAGGSKDKIKIEPDVKQFPSYQFPEVCTLVEELNQGTQSSGGEQKSIVLDDHLQKLRDKIIDLLKLAEAIKNSRSYIEQISRHLDMNEDHSILKKFENQLSSLAKRESQLQRIKHKIQNLTATLNEMINKYNQNPKNNQFKAVSLNFEIQNYAAKISYLQALKVSSTNKAAIQPHTNFTDFFHKLAKDLNSESKQIEFIDTYFQNMSHLSYLKDTANSLRDNIQVDRLNIEYKRSCEAERNSYTSKSSTPSQIKQTLEHLRQKKKQYGGGNNKYCEGVANKLENQIKRLLKAINWTFMCADGLKDLVSKRDAQIEKLKQIEEIIRNFETQSYDSYQQRYERTKGAVRAKLDQIKHFRIDEYTHDPVQIEGLIQQAQRKKQEAENELSKLPQEPNTIHNFDNIKQLAEEIKKEKANFCYNYEPYQVESRKLWFHIYRYEQNEKYEAKMRGQFIKQVQKLSVLETNYKELSEIVIEAIKQNYKSK